MAKEIITFDGEWQFAYTTEAPEASAGDIPEEEDFEINLPIPAYWDGCRSYMKYAKFWSRKCIFNPETRRVEESGRNAGLRRECPKRRPGGQGAVRGYAPVSVRGGISSARGAESRLAAGSHGKESEGGG